MTDRSHGVGVPKQTFFNLPDDKRERFVAEALKEFASHPYDQASVSAIVDRLGIAKGSVYQYFDDKLDLYRWLVEESSRRELAFYAEHPPLHEEGFFERIRELFRLGMDWWRQFPLWARVGARMMEPSREQRLAEIRDESKRQAHQWLREQLERGITQGSVRADLDLDVLVYLVTGFMQQGLLDAMLGISGLELSELAEDPDRVERAHIHEVVDVAMTLLEHGLKPGP